MKRAYQKYTNQYIWIVFIQNFQLHMNSNLQELALGLAGLLDFQIPQNTDPFEPTIILQALSKLFPQDEAQLTVIQQVDQIQEQWNCVLEYIQINLLEGQTLEIQDLGEQQIAQIYLLLIQFAQHSIKEKEEQELLNRHRNKQSKKQVKENSRQKEKNASNQKAKDKKKKNKEIEKKEMHKESHKQSHKEKKLKQQKLLHKKQVEDSSVNNRQKPKENKNNKSKQKMKEKESQLYKNIQVQKANSRNNSKSKSKSKSNGKVKQRQSSQHLAAAKKAGNKKSPKKQIVSDEPLQNEAIREITATMKHTKKNQTNKILLKDPKSHQQVVKARRQFDYYLNEFKRQGKNSKAKNKKEGKGILDQYFLKVIEKRQKNVQQTIVNEQIKYLLQLRDKKIAFINKIHKLTEKLQRERVIEKQKQQKKLMQQQRIKTHMKIQQSNAVFDKNMELLKQNYKVMRQKNELQTYDQRVMCRQMQECMKRKKLDELQELKILWQQQNLKLNNIMGDEQKIKNKLIDIYRRNRP